MITVFDLQKIIMACAKNEIRKNSLKREINLMIISQLKKIQKKRKQKCSLNFNKID